MARGLLRLMLSPVRLIGPLVRFAPAARAFARDVLRPEYPANATRFNSVVSSHRVFDTRRFALDEFESIRRLVRGATLDDAVLAVCAGGMRRYLGRHGELPEVDLTALVTASDTPCRRVPLGTTLADPLERLALIRDRAAQTGNPGRIGAAHVLDSCKITRLPAPAAPLYLCGARMTYFSAILPISDGTGLAFAVTCYDGRVVVSPTSCRELMPDPQAFTQCVRDSFQECLALARPVAAPTAAAKPRSAAPRGSASGRHSRAARPARTGATVLQLAKDGRRRSRARRR